MSAPVSQPHMKAITIKQAAEMLKDCGIANLENKLRDGRLKGIEPFRDYDGAPGKRGAAWFVYEEEVSNFLFQRRAAREKKIRKEIREVVPTYKPALIEIEEQLGYLPPKMARMLMGQSRRKKKDDSSCDAEEKARVMKMLPA